MSDFFNKYPYTDFHELNLDWVIERVKKLTEDWLATQQEWNDTEEQWQQLHDYVMDYFANLDVQDEINNKINAMIADGTFLTLITPTMNDTIVSAVNEWLNTHITPSTPIVDDTLSIPGAAADSAVVGDRFDTVFENFSYISHIGKNKFGAEWENGKGLNGSGSEIDNIRNGLSGFFAVDSDTVYTAKLDGVGLTFTNLYVAFFDSSLNFISSPSPAAGHVITFTTPATCAYCRLQTYQTATTGTGLVPDTTQVELGKIATDFEPHGFHIINEESVITDTDLLNEDLPANAKITGDTFRDISVQGKNKFSGTWQNGIQIDADGYEVESIRNASSSYIVIEPSTQYTVKCYGASLTFTHIYVIFYDAAKEKLSVVSGAGQQYTFTTPATCSYVRIMTYQAATTGTGLVPDQTQIEYGNVATAYESYTHIIKKEALAGGLETYEPTEKLYNQATMIHCTKVSSTSENPYADDSILYQCKELKISADGTTAVGVEWYLKGLQAGNAIRLYGIRDTGNNFFVRYTALDGAGSVIIQKFYNMGDIISFIIPEGTAQLNVTLAACWGTALPADTVVTFSNLMINYYTPEGVGYNNYSGNKINLAIEDSEKVNRCNIEIWKDFTNVGAYNLHKAQGMAIYNDYVFVFRDGGGGIVLDYTTGNIIDEFSTTPTSNNHQNCANFTNIFYDPDDEFPLVLVSRCIGPTYDECLIYRITRAGTAFTFTLVNSIRFNTTTYGLTWGVDLNQNELVVTGFINGDWQVTVDNPIHIWRFKMPSVADILSGTEILLEWSDVIIDALFPHQIPQGLEYHNGLLYSAMQIGAAKTPTVQAFNIEKNIILSSVIMPLVREPEDVAIYNNYMFVSQVDSTDTAGTNPLRISRITF